MQDHTRHGFAVSSAKAKIMLLCVPDIVHVTLELVSGFENLSLEMGYGHLCSQLNR